MLLLTASAIVRAQNASAPAAKPPAKPAPLPPSLQTTLGQYGNIVAPGDQMPYALKLRLPNPTEGEVRVPKPEDLLKREKLEALAELTDDQIRKQLAAWPVFSKMSLRDQAAMLQRIQDFRDYHYHVAIQTARARGLLTLTPPQLAKFEREYWSKRLKLDEALAKQFQPIYAAQEQVMNDELFTEFSSAMPAPKPPAKPAAKPLAKTSVPASTNANATAPPPIVQAQLSR